MCGPCWLRRDVRGPGQGAKGERPSCAPGTMYRTRRRAICLRMRPVLLLCVALCGCSGLTEITPEQAAPRSADGAVPTPTGAAPGAVAPSPVSITRAECGPDAPLGLTPACRPVAIDRSRQTLATPDSAAWHQARRDEARARDELIRTRNRQARIAVQPGVARPGEENRLRRQEMQLEQDLLRSPRQTLGTAPFGTVGSRGRYGL